MDSIILGIALLFTFAVLDMWFMDFKNKSDKYDATRNTTALITCALWALFHFFTH